MYPVALLHRYIAGMSSFNGKNILVVGGSSGIGEAVVSQLLREDASVWLWSRRERKDLVEQGVTCQSVDVTTDFDTESFSLPEILHGVVYAPGTINLAPFRMLKLDTFLQDYQVNVLGAVRVLKGVEERLFAAQGASVVLFSTVAVRRGMQFHTSIAAAKGAVEGLTISLAAEWAGRKVRVNAVAPSLTDTPLASRLLGNEKKAEAAAQRHPLGRVGTPDELGRATCFLLHGDTSWITGQVLGVDGGLGALSGF